MTADDTADLRGIKGWLALLALYQIITVIKVTVTYVQSFGLYLAPLEQPGPHLLVVRPRHLHPRDTGLRANVSVKRTTSKSLG